MTSSDNHVTPPTFFTQKCSTPKTVMARFGWNFLLVEVIRHSPSQKTLEKLTGKRERNFLNLLVN